jgi:hypothetical protein
MSDLFQMLQSSTFMHQLGYALLRIVVVGLFPKLQRLFREVEEGIAHGECPAYLQYKQYMME